MTACSPFSNRAGFSASGSVSTTGPLRPKAPRVLVTLQRNHDIPPRHCLRRQLGADCCNLPFHPPVKARSRARLGVAVEVPRSTQRRSAVSRHARAVRGAEAPADSRLGTTLPKTALHVGKASVRTPQKSKRPRPLDRGHPWISARSAARRSLPHCLAPVPSGGGPSVGRTTVRAARSASPSVRRPAAHRFRGHRRSRRWAHR